MIQIGPITFYELRSAMHGGIDIKTRRWGYICLKPPTRVFGCWWPAYFYLSPYATPWAATFLMGREYAAWEKKLACVRRALWGHGYDPSEHDPQKAESYLSCIVGDLPPTPGSRVRPSEDSS